ncbi:MAG TPA: hypothetical protein VNF29_11135, partial [Candidatus Binataceae bacterium]|nr:hypothetical protein [Candidatus Binataceae bacterium]
MRDPGEAARPAPRGEDFLLREFQTTRTPGLTAREYLASVRAELAEFHFKGASGSEIVRMHTA